MPEKLEITRPDRWDNPFGTDMSSADVERIGRLPVFLDIDPNLFPKNLTLRDIIRNDCRIVEYGPGEVILRKGAYGNSVFFVMSGSIRIIEESDEKDIIDRQTDARSKNRNRTVRALIAVARQLGTIWRAMRTQLRNSRVPERRDVAGYGNGPIGMRGAGGQAARIRLENFETIVSTYPTVQLTENQVFGESAALSRAPHSATVVAETTAKLLELRWQGLRDMRHWDQKFRDRLDQIYRAESLRNHLRECPLFKDVDDASLDTIASQTLFESHGEAEWAHGFKRVASKDINEIINSEPVIADQDGYIDGIMLIRMGFGRLTEQLDLGHRTVGYLSQNEVFGLAEIVDHWRGNGELRYRHGLRAVGYVDVLRIPTTVVEEYLLPVLYPDTEQADTPRRRRRPRDSGEPDVLEESILNFLVNNRTINGRAVMAIDTRRCVGCDDCVRACAAGHDGNPRFVRQGPEHANVMVTNACMHCVDPVCLIGCPTGAIHRSTEDGVVVIDDATCIGCTICANSCPYDNIRMVQIRNPKGRLIIDEATHEPIVKATKCDFCSGLPGGPACQRACPHDALIRIDACDREMLADWINR